MTLGSNGRSISGSFVRNASADLPQSSVSYEEALAMQRVLTVPQTAPSIPSVGNALVTNEVENGMRWIKLQNPHGDWNNSEIFSPPEEYLAKKDIERQKRLEQKMISELSPEQKEMLRKLNAGELMPKPNLIEESKRMNP